MILWLVFFGALFVTGWRAFIRCNLPAGLLLAILVAGFASRMVLESIGRDHMLQIFFFLNGALLSAIAHNAGRDLHMAPSPAASDQGACLEELVEAAGDGLLDWSLEWHISVLKKQVSGGKR